MNEKTNPVESFDRAAEHYSLVEKYVQSVGDKIEEAMGKENFQSEIFVRQFDFVLQIILLKVITADGEADWSEIFAIKNIPQHGDITEYLNANMQDKISWESFAGADIQRLAAFSSMLDTSLDNILANFMESVAFVDVNGETKERVFIEIANGVDKIATAVAGVDGLIEGSERFRIYESIISILRKKYDEAVELLFQKSQPGKA